MAGSAEVGTGDWVYLCKEGQVMVFQAEQRSPWELVSPEALRDLDFAFFRVSSEDSPEPGKPLGRAGKITLQHSISQHWLSLSDSRIQLQPQRSALLIQLAGDQERSIQDKDYVSLAVEDSRVSDIQLCRYAAYDTSEALHYGQPFRLHTGALYLSVQPLYSHSNRIAIREEDQRADFTGPADALVYPEYYGELQADMTNNAEDWNNWWAAERADRLLGGLVSAGEGVFLRHVGSGGYLGRDGGIEVREKAAEWVFAADSDLEVPFHAAVVMAGRDFPGLGLDKAPTEANFQALLFLPNCVSAKQHFRLPLSSACPPLSTVSLRPIPASTRSSLLHLAALQPIFARLRSLLQNVIRIPEAGAALQAYEAEISLSQAAKAIQSQDSCTMMAADLQIINELLRLWGLMKITAGLFPFSVKELECHRAVLGLIGSLVGSPYVSAAVFARRALLNPLISVAPFSIAKLLRSSLTFPLPLISDHLHWVHTFTSLSQELKSYGQYIHLSAFVYRLLATLPLTVQLNDLPVLKLGEEFVLKIQKTEASCAVWSFGVMRPMAEVGEKLSLFVCSMLQLAAVLSIHSPHKAQIEAEMGLQPDRLVDAFADAHEKPLVQVGILTYLTIVHLPALAGHDFPLARLLDGVLVNETVFLEAALALEQIRSIDSFIQRESQLQHLVRFEANFWLCELLSQEKGQSSSWYLLLTAHLAFLTQLVNYRCVSDVFTVLTFECVQAVLRDLIIAADGNPAEIDGNGRERTEFLVQLLDYIETIQLWRLFRVTQELIVSSEFTLSEGLVGSLLSSLAGVSVMRRYMEGLEGRKDPESPLLQAMSILVSSPDKDTEGLLVCLAQTFPVLGQARAAQLQRLIYREEREIEWIEGFLKTASDESRSLPFLMMVRPLVAYQDYLGSADSKETGELIASMESLYDIMDTLTEANLRNFQELLHQANFLHHLDRLWIRADSLKDTEAAEGVDLVSLVLDVTRIYCRDSEEGKEEVRDMMGDHCCFLDYPQYLSLLNEIGVLREDQVPGLAEILVDQAVATGLKRPILALEVLLGVKECLPACLIAVSKRLLGSLEPTAAHWEILIAVARATPPSFRMRLFGPLLSLWYEIDPSQIRREGAAVLIYASDTRSPLFHNGLSETISHLEQVLTAQHLSEAHLKICGHVRLQRGRNNEHCGSDLLYVLELLWHSTAGVVVQIPGWMPKISLQDLMVGLARLYISLPGVDALKEQLNLLVNVLRLYTLKTDDTLQDEDRDLLLTACLKEVELEPEEPSTLLVRPLTTLFSSEAPQALMEGNAAQALEGTEVGLLPEEVPKPSIEGPAIAEVKAAEGTEKAKSDPELQVSETSETAVELPKAPLDSEIPLEEQKSSGAAQEIPPNLEEPQASPPSEAPKSTESTQEPPPNSQFPEVPKDSVPSALPQDSPISDFPQPSPVPQDPSEAPKPGNSSQLP